MAKGLSTGKLATALPALAAVSVFALISALSPPVAAHTARPDLASAVATLPGADDQATGVTCVPNGPCIAIDYSGQVYILSGRHVEAAGDIGVVTFGVSCPTRTFCAMVSEGAAVVLRPSGATEYPLQYGKGSDTHWQSISCSSPSFCMAGGGLIGGAEDGAGVVASWNGATWSSVQVVLPDIPYDFKTQISSMSCAGPSLCVAADEEQRVLQWNGTKWTAPNCAQRIRHHRSLVLVQEILLGIGTEFVFRVDLEWRIVATFGAERFTIIVRQPIRQLPVLL